MAKKGFFAIVIILLLCVGVASAYAMPDEAEAVSEVGLLETAQPEAVAASVPQPISSPDGTVTAQVWLSGGKLFYNLQKNGTTILETSKLGITTNVGNFTSGLSYVSETQQTINETYSLPQAKKAVYQNHCNETRYVFQKGSATMELYFRAYNDGIAYRYYIPGSGMASISGESTTFNLPDGTGGWAFGWRNDYEGKHEYYGPTSFNSANFAMPVLASINNNAYWALLTEGNVYNGGGSYCTSHLDGSIGQEMKLAFAPEQTSAVVTQYPFESPYRVVIVSDSLNSLANSTLVENLNPPSIISDTSWIQPGKAAWSWWSEERSPQWLLRQKEYVDFASRHGWEYVTVDAGWDESWVADLCAYAGARGVKVLVWTDVGALDTPVEVNAKLPLWASWGVSGFKVDFMMNDAQSRMATYQLIAEKAAQLELLVNFHGSTKPAGEMRTWPHVVTTEGVRGSEHYKWSDYSTAYQNCTLPFTRNVVGPMDFTPVVISNENLNTTQAHQLALSVVFESGIQHFADTIDSYEPWKGTSFLDAVPVTWDETRLLEGFPGDYATIARRSGADWFVGAITDDARTASINCSFLSSGSYTAYIYKDGADGDFITISSQTVTSASVLNVPLLATGGSAVLITKSPFNPDVSDDPAYTYYEAEGAGNTRSGGASLTSNANASGGMKVGYLGGSSGGAVQFNSVHAPTAGTYELKLFYCGIDKRSFAVTVNGVSAGTHAAPDSGSFNTLRTISLQVTLKAGSNVIKIGNTGGYAPDLDRIAIKAVTPPPQYTREAESGLNTLGGGANIVTEANASGGKKVGYIGSGGTLTFSNLSVAQSGPYVMRIYYLTGDNREVHLNINGGATQKVLCFDSGSFNSVEYKEALVTLLAGNNTIVMSHAGGYSPDIDKIVLIKY